MKTLYAVIFVLLSSPAIADVLDITPTGTDDTTSAISAPVPQAIEHALDFDVDYVDYVDEHKVEPAPANPPKPIDLAEIQIAAGPGEIFTEDDHHTAGVISPATLKTDDNPITLEVVSTQDEETGFDWE